jgi:MoxR-like ATPase
LPTTDPELAKIIASVDAVLDADPEGKKISATIRAETLKRALSKYGGKTYTSTGANDDIPWQDEEAYPDQVVRPTELVIPETPDAPYWYDDPTQARFIDHYILAKRQLGPAMHGALLVTGPSGAGKTQGVQVAVDRVNAARGLSLTLQKFDCATTTDPGKWIGRREIDAAGSHFYESDLMIAIQKPDTVVLFDEINRLHPTLTNLIMPLLDGSRALHVSDMNVTIPVHPSVVFIATANIGASFGGVHRFDQALRERFGYTLERDFPPREEEIKVLVTNTGCDVDGASVLVDVAEKTRQMFATGDLRSPISTRSLVGAAWLVASGFTERESLELTVLPLYDGDANGTVGQESERARVSAILAGRMGR